MHHLSEVEGMSLRGVEYIVFDEADRLFEMGFADQLKQVGGWGCRVQCVGQLGVEGREALGSKTLAQAMARHPSCLFRFCARARPGCCRSCPSCPRAARRCSSRPLCPRRWRSLRVRG